MTGDASTQAARARFLALGDSYTIGEGVDAGGRWPDQLAAALRASGLAVATPEIVARTGWTTGELAAAMDRHAFHPPYDLVTLLIGVNNQYRAGQEPKCPGGQGGPGGAGRDLDNYRGEFRTLLERAIALAGNRPQRVVVVSIPDWGVTRFGQSSGRDTAKVAHELDLYNVANAEIAASLHVRYADVTPASRDGGDHADMLAGDGLHPSATMYRRWLAVIQPQARAALSKD
ncbi:MAG TPA: SGNH/GDSL hydrolase family protein [Rudaea sp.]|nr:SGNH/GDSL hydrolase family protein [Rudaea sp.]